MSYVFIGICIAYVYSSFCSHMGVVVTHLFPTCHLASLLRDWSLCRLVRSLYIFIERILRIKYHKNVSRAHFKVCLVYLRDWSLTTGRGPQHGKIVCPKLFASPLKAG